MKLINKMAIVFSITMCLTSCSEYVEQDALELSQARTVELIKEKQRQDAPVTAYKDLPVTQGAGRFGPFLKWNSFFINIPRRYDPENLTEAEMHELIAAKEEKEANRYIHKWDDLKLTVENGRWGPFIRFAKHKIQLKNEGKRLTSEEAAEMTLEQVKALVIEVEPKAFQPKKKPVRKKAAAKKTTAKKATAKKKTTTKKAAPKKK